MVMELSPLVYKPVHCSTQLPIKFVINIMIPPLLNIHIIVSLFCTFSGFSPRGRHEARLITSVRRIKALFTMRLRRVMMISGLAPLSELSAFSSVLRIYTKASHGTCSSVSTRSTSGITSPLLYSYSINYRFHELKVS